MRKRIVFLDIDGVLNTPDFLKRSGTSEAMDARRVALLKSVFDDVTDVDIGMETTIVISSAWRHGPDDTWEQRVRGAFADAGWSDPPIIGRTPTLPAGRGEEIRAWLLEHVGETFAEDVVFAIVDDDTFDLLPEQAEMIIACDTNLGFTDLQHGELRAMLGAMTIEEVLEALAPLGITANQVFMVQGDASPDVQHRQFREIGEILYGRENESDE